MKKPHLLARCLEPTAITEDALRVCIAVASDDRYFADDRARALESAGGIESLMMADPRPAMTVADGVATIAIDGPLVRKAAGINDVSGITSYAAIRNDFRAASKDSAVQSIDFAIDSPGGEVSGLFELADEINAGDKPRRALVARANSAAYLLAAAIGDISIEQAGQAGSIGVIAGVAKPDASGNETIDFVSSVSPLKNADPTTDEGRAAFQSRVDFLGEQLVEKVAQFRGVSVETVKDNFGKGAVLIGSQAVAAGLVDRVGVVAKEIAPMNPEIVGLAKDASEADIKAHVEALASFRATVLEATGATDAASALGKIAAGVEARAHVEGIEAELAAERQRGYSRALSDGLTSALSGDKPRLTLGELTRVVPALLGGSRAAAVDALGKVEAQEGPALVAAIASVPLSAEAVEAVSAYLEAKAPPVRVPVAVEPAIPAAAVAEMSPADKELNDRISAAGDEARAVFARNRGPRATNDKK